MISRRFAAFALAALALAGCHEDPTVTVNFPSKAATLTITTDGGTTTVTPLNVAGSANDAGPLLAVVLGDMNLGGGGSLTAPTLPTAPTTGTVLTNAAAIAGLPLHGNILVSATLQIVEAVAPTTHVIETDTGDIVISSGLIAAVSTGAATSSITLNAPSGTVYITGTVTLSGTAGNPNAGDLTINAARIVISGTINALGLAGTATGGKGGKVTMATSTGNIQLTGAINTSGGIGTAAGDGGDINLSAGNNLLVFNNLTADGGASTDLGGVTAPAGGKGGAVLLNGKGGVDVSSLVSLHGGDATGGAVGAAGGTGNDFSVNSAAPVRIYGSIITRGGTATATTGSTSVTLSGGAGGGVYLGVLAGGGPGTPLASLELGSGPWSTSGGSGVDAAGNAAGMDFRTSNGTITVGANLKAAGGSATGAATTTGGKGGSITIYGDQDLGSVGQHALHILFGVDTTIPGGPTTSVTAAMTTTGGAGTGGGNGGVGGDITLRCGGDLSSAIVMTTTGGAAATGAGGPAGNVTMTLASTAAGTKGDATLSGSFLMKGGISTGGGGGTGGSLTVDLSASDPGSITCSAAITTSGTDGLGAGAAGFPGNVTFTAHRGDIALSGTIAGLGGNSLTIPRAGATLSATCELGGGISSSAAVSLTGGGSLAASGVDVSGTLGGNVFFEVQNTIGGILLSFGTSIQADGGRATGTLGNAGGGGTLRLRTVDQAVSMFGSTLLRGGSATGGLGGLGGQVIVNSDTNGDGTGGDITLQASSSIDVSGGADSPAVGGGNARNNSGAAIDPVGALANIAVVFDADGGLGASADSLLGGIVQNLGTITARGVGSAGLGGDVWFDGRGALAGDPVSGSLTKTGVVTPATDGIFTTN